MSTAKRPREPDADEDVQDSGTYPRNQRRKIKESTIDTTFRKVPFACPFAKHNPSTYMKRRPCCGPGWTEIGRVKEHLYRCHSLPKYSCPRCFWTSESQVELNRHSRANPPCKTIEQNPNPDDGLNEDQKSKIRSRKYHATGCGPVSEADRWKQIYRICFPTVEEDEVPSPYYSHPSPDPSEFGDILLQPIPDTIREQIRTEVELNAKSWQEHGSDILVDFIADIIPRIMATTDSAYLSDREQQQHGGTVSTSSGCSAFDVPEGPAVALVTSLAQTTCQFTTAGSSVPGYHFQSAASIHHDQTQAHQLSPTCNYAAEFGTTDLRHMNLFDGDLLKELLWVDTEKYRM